VQRKLFELSGVRFASAESIVIKALKALASASPTATKGMMRYPETKDSAIAPITRIQAAIESGIPNVTKPDPTRRDYGDRRCPLFRRIVVLTLGNFAVFVDR